MEKKSNIKKKSETSRQPKKRIWGRVLLIFFSTLLVVCVGITGGFVTASFNTKPNLAEDIIPSASSQIYDVNGQEIANIHATENRVPVTLKQIPYTLQNAFIAVEDNRFYEHIGIDFRGILRAIWANIRGGEVAEGGSTITQQLAKNAYLTQDRTIKRKIQEIFLALQLERQYTKQEILEFYLNQIYFGQGAYGVQAAAKTYFNKDVSELSLNEAAMLAGIPKSPNYYSPFNNLEAANARKATVLSQMVKYGYISTSEANEAEREELILAKTTDATNTNGISYFLNYVVQLVIDKYGDEAVYKDGLQIYTTLDMNTQAYAYNAMQNLPTFFVDNNGVEQPQGALVAINPHNGYVRAMIGGRGTDQFNRATQAVRQPGSAFKPFVFIAALENNFTPDTIIEDKPIKVGGWEPQNYSRTFSGKVRLRDVARLSLNVPTVRIAQELGMDKPIYYAQEMGISTFVLNGAQNDRNLATALGGMTRGVTPLELTSAYGTFANNGVYVEPVVITKIISRTGKILEETPQKEHNVVSADNVAALNHMLQEVINRGTGTRAAIGRPAAGKTGTTSDYHDAWFVGYTPDLVAGVWVGTDNNAELRGMSGGLTPAIIWQSFMIQALQGVSVKNFPNVERYASKEDLLELKSTEEDVSRDEAADKSNTKNTDKEDKSAAKKRRKDESTKDNKETVETKQPPDEPSRSVDKTKN